MAVSPSLQYCGMVVGLDLALGTLEQVRQGKLSQGRLSEGKESQGKLIQGNKSKVNRIVQCSAV